MSYHAYTIVPFLRGLKGLKHTLNKAEEHAKASNISVDDYVTASLIDDMKDLAFQVFFAANLATKAFYRPALQEPPAQENNDKTFADFHKRIDEAIALLEKADPAVYAANDGKSFKVPLGPKQYEMTAESYSTIYAGPNFYFHLVTAYDILRAKGVPVGKLDFLNGYLEGLQEP